MVHVIEAGVYMLTLGAACLAFVFIVQEKAPPFSRGCYALTVANLHDRCQLHLSHVKSTLITQVPCDTVDVQREGQGQYPVLSNQFASFIPIKESQVMMDEVCDAPSAQVYRQIEMRISSDPFAGSMLIRLRALPSQFFAQAIFLHKSSLEHKATRDNLPESGKSCSSTRTNCWEKNRMGNVSLGLGLFGNTLDFSNPQGVCMGGYDVSLRLAHAPKLCARYENFMMGQVGPRAHHAITFAGGLVSAHS